MMKLDGQLARLRWKSAFGLAMTLIFDLLTSKCNQFIFVLHC